MPYIEPIEHVPDPTLTCSCGKHFCQDCGRNDSGEQDDNDLCDECASEKGRCYYKHY